MHIVQATEGYWGDSGVFTHVRDLSVHLAAKGHDVTVLSPDVDATKSTSRLRLMRVADTPVVPHLLLFFIQLVRAHVRQRIDIVHVHSSVVFLAAYWFSKSCRVPTAFTFQASIFSPNREVDYPRSTVLIYRFTNRFVSRHADALVCVSHEMARCARYGGAEDDKINLISNLVDLDAFADIREARTQRSYRGGKVCLYVGALRPVKGVEYLIRAVPMVTRRMPEARFVLVGDGPKRTALESLCDTLGVRDAVRFVGRLPWRKAIECYRDADLFVLPSLSDPKPVVLAEALAAGLPVVATNVDGIPEMIQDDYTGYLVPPSDSQALASAIANLLSDGERRRRLGKNALESAEQFSWERNIDRFVTLYANLVRMSEKWKR